MCIPCSLHSHESIDVHTYPLVHSLCSVTHCSTWAPHSLLGFPVWLVALFHMLIFSC